MEDKLVLMVIVAKKGVVLGAQTQSINEEILDLKEGPFNMEHTLEDIARKTVREVYTKHSENAEEK